MRVKKVTPSEVIVKTKWFKISHLEATYDDNSQVDWEFLDEENDAVSGVLIDDNNFLYLVKEWWGAWRSEVISVVTGGIAKGLDQKAAAREFVREAREETGFRPQKVTFLAKLRFSLSSRGYRYIFLGENLKKDPLPPDDGEKIEVIKLPFDEGMKLIFSSPPQLTVYSALALILAKRKLGL